MARISAYPTLNVFLNSRLVGHLDRESNGAILFQYDKSWLDWEYASPVSLSLPLREEVYSGAPVIAVFDNLLPDNDGIRQRIAAKVQAEGIDAHSMLAALGRDCVGALQFLPPDEDPGPAGTHEGTPLTDAEIANIIRNLAQNPLGIGEDEDFRISLAGAQEKTALLRQNGQWYRPVGTTATTHILKPQIGQLPNGIDLSNSVENEYFCLKMCEALRISTAKVEMFDFEDKRVLAVERFDREWTRNNRLLRLPQEDCCQALSVPPTRKYQADGGPGIADIMELLLSSDNPHGDRFQFLRANIVFWLLGATDGHAKNFSIRLYPGGRFNITPLYDVISAQPSVDTHQIRHNKMKLAMSVGEHRHYVVDSIAARHFVETAQETGLGDKMLNVILYDLLKTCDHAIETVINELPNDFPQQVATSISNGMRKRLEMIKLHRDVSSHM